MSFYDAVASTTGTAITVAKGTVVASTGISILLSALLYFKQSSLIYPRYLPEGARTEVPTPDEVNIQDWERVKLFTKDGETLNSYFIKARRPAGVTVLFMHGNAGNIGHRLQIAKIFAESMGCNFFMLSYRGYGLSTGRPSEKGLIIDAQTALDYLLDNPEAKDTKIFAYGQSLGGALAIQLTVKNQGKISGLVLENTFRSMRTLIPSAFPPAKYLARLCHQIWPSETTLPLIEHTPTLFLSGLRDEIVPPSHMATLHNVCVSPKMWIEFPLGSHNDTHAETGYFDAILDFVKKVVRGEPIASEKHQANSSNRSSSDSRKDSAISDL